MPEVFDLLWQAGFFGQVDFNTPKQVLIGGTHNFWIQPPLLYGPDADSITRFVEENLWRPLISQLHSSLSVNSIVLGRVDRPFSSYPQYPSTLQGQQGGTRLPVFSAVRVTLKSAYRGLRSQGRRQWGPLASTDVDQDLLTPAALQRFWTVAQLLTSTWQVNAPGGVYSLVPVIWSRASSDMKFPFGSIIVGDRITAAVVNRRVSTWRNRRPRSITAP